MLEAGSVYVTGLLDTYSIGGLLSCLESHINRVYLILNKKYAPKYALKNISPSILRQFSIPVCCNAK